MAFERGFRDRPTGHRCRCPPGPRLSALRAPVPEEGDPAERRQLVHVRLWHGACSSCSNIATARAGRCSRLPATCAALSVGVALLCLRKGATDRVDKVEATAFSADVWLTLLWAAIAFGYGNISPFSAGFLLAGNVTTLTAFFPVLRSTWRTPEREQPEPWLVWTAAYSLLALVTLLADQGPPSGPARLSAAERRPARLESRVMALRGRAGLSRAGSTRPGRSISAGARSMAKA